MAVKELSATLISRFIQDAGTKTTPGYHKTKLGDAWEKSKKYLDEWRWAQGATFKSKEAGYNRISILGLWFLIIKYKICEPVEVFVLLGAKCFSLTVC